MKAKLIKMTAHLLAFYNLTRNKTYEVEPVTLHIFPQVRITNDEGNPIGPLSASRFMFEGSKYCYCGECSREILREQWEALDGVCQFCESKGKELPKKKKGKALSRD